MIDLRIILGWHLPALSRGAAICCLVAAPSRYVGGFQAVRVAPSSRACSFGAAARLGYGRAALGLAGAAEFLRRKLKLHCVASSAVGGLGAMIPGKPLRCRHEGWEMLRGLTSG